MDATFTWVGSTDSNSLIELATVDGQPVDQSTGFSGAIQIIGNNFLQLLELPQSLGFPNNGFLDGYAPIAFDPKNWGIRPDGSPMDGTQPGDAYMKTGTASLSLWNGTANISITEIRQIVQHRQSGRYFSKIVLNDVMQGGSGSASATVTEEMEQRKP